MKKKFFIIDSRLRKIESLLIELKKASLPDQLRSLPNDASAYALEYFPNLYVLAIFFGVSYRTIKRWKRDQRIRCIQVGSSVQSLINDVLYAIQNDPIIRKQFLKRMKEIPNSKKPSSSLVPPKIKVETELYPGRFIFATIKYQNWKCCACIPYHIWTQPDKVEDFVGQIILARHERYPFPISPSVSAPMN